MIIRQFCLDMFTFRGSLIFYFTHINIAWSFKKKLKCSPLTTKIKAAIDMTKKLKVVIKPLGPTGVGPTGSRP